MNTNLQRRGLLATKVAGALVILWFAGPGAATRCLAVANGDEFSSRFASTASFRTFVEQGWDSPFGLDYVFVHSAAAHDRALVDGFCEHIAIRWVNFTRLEWSRIEPRPPVAGKHSYDWSDMDQAVRQWQRNGIHIMVSLRFFSPWASAERDGKHFVYLKGPAKWLALKGADYIPKPEHWKDFRDYVRNLVERYDGDGRNDMPGLLFPILHYQVGNEYYNELFWAGSVEEYGQLLSQFSETARAACPNVKVILSGIGFKDVYGFYGVSMSPRTQAYVKRHLLEVPHGMLGFVDRSYAFSKASVAMCDAYDILDARWPDYGIVARSKQLLAEAKCGGKEVWSAEIYSNFPLLEPVVLPNWTLHAWPTPSRSKEYLRILKNRQHPHFDTINAWYRRLQAAQVVKVCAVALDAGSRKLMVGWAVDFQHPLAASSSSHNGLYSATFKQWWPAAYTYDLTIRKLDGLKRIRRRRTPREIYVYECIVDSGRRVLIAFHDDHIGQNHDEPTGTVAAAIPVGATRVRITSIVTEIGQTEPTVQTVDVAGGVLHTRLTEYPVFIEPVSSRE